MLYYYNAAPQLRRIEIRLEFAIHEARCRKRRRRRELKQHPASPGPSPDEAEAAALREAINNALFSLRLLHE